MCASCCSSHQFLSKNYPPPNEVPSPENALRLVQQWLLFSSLGQALLKSGIGRELQVQQVSGGITNILYRVTAAPIYSHTHLETALVNSNSDEQVQCFLRYGVGVRFFGCAKADIVDRKKEAAMLDYLSIQGLCKRVFYRFEGGQIDEWRLGRCITLDEMKDPAVSQAVALQLSALHRVRLPRNFEGGDAEETAASSGDFEGDSEETAASPGATDSTRKETAEDTSQTWAQIWKWFALLAELKKKHAAPEILEGVDLEALRTAAVETRRNNACFQSPLVMCHNDLLNGNIVKVEDGCVSASPSSPPRIEFIDFEYAGVGERGFDIANHFCEMAGFECDYSLLPDRNFQLAFLNCYLQALEDDMGEDETRIPNSSSEDSSDQSSSPEVMQNRRPLVLSSSVPTDNKRGEMILPEIEAFMTTSHFFWGLWALVQAVQWRDSNHAPCDYLSYAHRRLAQLRPSSL
eukprot:Gregarina_sp_Pseudo_9__769@NODE_1494_length_1548_cov_4_783963_g1384_i0_p1_GENE_NODE_1494_length_1548_cov_4_783963_g1384_i0NODE_1494_length_1548_cov_4_783963_g1384_i0_p1_ORF_typecomplete_len472_score97_13Choline_kinase/PF01633_20/1_4e40APH/PF01636_23/6_3e10APH/PF01636_23/4_3e03EcKinase/PF02958_20/0_00068APH_6_hur/PF04655_14/0_011DUF1679/PF07914_11/0_027_NODE_1494_length_1548_cov_4_783963_g1384_i0321417